MNVAAIVLAAGRSRRMGAFKPLLPFGDKTVVESCVEYLSAGGAEPVIVVIGNRAAEIRERLAHLPVRIALNPDPDSEMSASIACGIAEVPEHCRAVLITPVDHAAVPAYVTKQLISEHERTGARLIQPEFEGRGGHPVLVDLSLRSELVGLDPNRGLRSLFDRYRKEVLRIGVATPFVTRDIDTWEDYSSLYRAVFGGEPPQEATAQARAGVRGATIESNENNGALI